jgi:predicted nucleotidyltransferase
MNYHEIEIPRERIAAFCRRNGIRRLSLFGSILGENFGADSDIDFLVEFEPGKVPSLLGMAELEIELSAMLGRQVDLRTPGDLSRYFRSEVMEKAVLQYASQD